MLPVLAFAPPPFDGFAASAYLVLVFLELLILLLAATLNPIAHYRRRRVKTKGSNEDVKANDPPNELL